MEVRILRQVVITPRGDIEVEQVTDYLNAMDVPRMRWVEGRIGLLEAIDSGDFLPNPPFERVPGAPALHQLVVDFDGEEHRIVFGERAGTWLLVWAFLDEGPSRRSLHLRNAIDLWRLPATT